MATRLIGTDDANPRLPALVIAATQGTTAADLAPGNIGQTVTTWSSPFASGVTVGNGTLAATYTRVGKVIVANLEFTLGSTSGVTATPTVNYPVIVATNWRPVINVAFLDSGVAWFPAGSVHNSATQFSILATITSATYATLGALSASVPFTWVTGDKIAISATYLAA